MNALRTPGLALVIFAAGSSTRLGSPKALARIKGSSLLRRTLRVTEKLAAHDTIIVVPKRHARYRREARGFAVRFVVNPMPGRGLSSSLLCGVRAARHASAVLLLPVDLAHLKQRELRSLVLRWQGRQRTIVARRVGRTAATPLILPHGRFCLAQRAAGDAGLREVINATRGPPVLFFDMPSASADIDTAEDLQKARRHRGLPLARH